MHLKKKDILLQTENATYKLPANTGTLNKILRTGL